MAKHQSIIELNGKRYDAHTGVLVAHAEKVHAMPKPASVHHKAAHAHASPAKHVHHHTERSKTLMRHAVKKPGKLIPHKPSAPSVMSDVIAPVRPMQALSKPQLYKQADTKREERAKEIKQSHLVRRFSDHREIAGLQPVTKKIEPLAVEPEPILSHHQPQFPAAEKLIERGLQAAQSHVHSEKHGRHAKKRSSRLTRISAASMAVLLFGVFFAYQNIPNVSMRYASAKAGVSAQLPSYQPAGFSLSNRIQYTPGQVTLNFSSNSDERAYTLIQRTSTWNSDTLVSNYVANKADDFQTFEDKGRTIYLYGESGATWVNGGVWYEIQGNASLNQEQLIRIATSI